MNDYWYGCLLLCFFRWSIQAAMVETPGRLLFKKQRSPPGSPVDVACCAGQTLGWRANCRTNTKKVKWKAWSNTHGYILVHVDFSESFSWEKNTEEHDWIHLVHCWGRDAFRVKPHRCLHPKFFMSRLRSTATLGVSICLATMSHKTLKNVSYTL